MTVFATFVATTLVCGAQADEDPCRLPDWFEHNRVQAHSEHGLELALRLTPEGHARVIRETGAEVLTRIYLTRDEGAWWPSRVGEVHPLIGERELPIEKTADGWRVSVPTFPINACVVAEY